MFPAKFVAAHEVRLLGRSGSGRAAEFAASVENDPGCVKTLGGITAPGILGSTVMRRAKNAKICLPLGIATKSDFVFTRPRPFTSVSVTRRNVRNWTRSGSRSTLETTRSTRSRPQISATASTATSTPGISAPKRTCKFYVQGGCTQLACCKMPLTAVF